MPLHAARRPIVVLTMGLALLVASCAGVPRPELQAYTDAFAKAQEGGIEVYRAMIPALRLAKASGQESDIPYSESLGPNRYERTDCPAGFAAYEALLVRCAAFGAVRGFNEALLALEQGGSVAAVQGRITGLKDSVGALAALLPTVGQVLAPVAPLVPALERAVAQLVTLRDRAALKAELDRAAPLIEQLIAALKADVPSIHDVQRAYYVKLLTDTESRIDDSVGAALAVADGHSRAVDPEAISARRRVDERFERIFSAAEPSPGEQRLRDLGREGQPPFTAADVEEIERALDATEREVATFRETAAGWRRFREALVAYDDMLAAVDQAFARLVAASSDPFAAGGGAAQVLESAFVIREQVAEIHRLLAARP